MRTIVLDGEQMTDRGQTHDYLAERLALPDFYGRNLDALHDCLSEIAQPTRLVLYRIAAIVERLGPYGLTLLRVLRESARQNPLLVIVLNHGETWPE
ncbi:MAG: barnase inhibitor [Clostridia bacterium]|nr:barstar family protein [Eubacteriales bacterium]MDD3867529.1 barstar family protein [Eubacteriales bacterium]MDD4460848.1 barstar family protein [Eubacteriales bacterium]NCC48871.1 barnase inhibitor [Clostridia bacterium]